MAKLQQARVYIHAINFRHAWREDAAGPETILAQIAAAGFAGDRYTLETPRGRASKGLNGDEVARAIRSGKEGTYILRPETSDAATLEIQDYGPLIAPIIDITLHDSALNSLMEIADLVQNLNAELTEFADIGPTMWLILSGFSYPRPLPPRRSSQIGEGVWAYFFSMRYARDHPDEAWKSNLQKLKHAPLASNLVRENYGDLLVIRASHGGEDIPALRDELGQLEKWIGETLDLPRDQDFKETGDRLWPVWQPERIKPFSFYDAAKKVAYKVVAEDKDQGLDPETMAELEASLPLRKMPDGRPIEATMVIFVEREAAIANLSSMRRLGAAGTLYRDDEDFWNPDPPGDWLAGSDG